jgi:hypothetical protein
LGIQKDRNNRGVKMAKIRCSNCEKSVERLIGKNVAYTERDDCAATGKDISGEEYFTERECDEFLPKIEYSQQFRTAFDKVMKGLAAGKAIKDIIK